MISKSDIDSKSESEDKLIAASRFVSLSSQLLFSGVVSEELRFPVLVRPLSFCLLGTHLRDVIPNCPCDLNFGVCRQASCRSSGGLRFFVLGIGMATRGAIFEEACCCWFAIYSSVIRWAVVHRKKQSGAAFENQELLFLLKKSHYQRSTSDRQEVHNGSTGSTGTIASSVRTLWIDLVVDRLWTLWTCGRSHFGCSGFPKLLNGF